MGMENGHLSGPQDKMARMLADTVLAFANPSTRLLKKAFWEEFGGAPPEGVVTYFSSRLRECELKGSLPMKVLVAMPETPLQNKLKAIAQKGGFAPICAGNQEDTLNLWTEHEPAMLVADADIAGFGGGIFLESLRRNTGLRPPYIILCTRRYDSTMEPILKMADDCAVKSLIENTLALRLSVGKAILAALYEANPAKANGCPSGAFAQYIMAMANAVCLGQEALDETARLLRFNLLLNRLAGILAEPEGMKDLPRLEALQKRAGQIAMLKNLADSRLLPDVMLAPLEKIATP